MPEQKPLLRRAATRLRRKWRAWLRAIHRDIGYLAVGLTFIYAVSGLAINHIEDWNPNFVGVDQTHQLELELSMNEREAVSTVLSELNINEQPSDYYMATDTQLEIYLNRRTLHVDTDTGVVFDEAEQPRFFLRVANWLHYNRGKDSWTYIADGYAAFLLFLAVSGMFMLPGRRGLLGRGGILILAGVSVPVLYVTLSGGP